MSEECRIHCACWPELAAKDARIAELSERINGILHREFKEQGLELAKWRERAEKSEADTQKIQMEADAQNLRQLKRMEDAGGIILEAEKQIARLKIDPTQRTWYLDKINSLSAANNALAEQVSRLRTALEEIEEMTLNGEPFHGNDAWKIAKEALNAKENR